MAESTLSLAFADLQTAVARQQGWAAPASWSAQNTEDFGIIIRRGLRKFYYPVSVEPGQPLHEWSFLHVFSTIVTVAGTTSYTLPVDCSGVVVRDSVGYSLGVQQHPLAVTGEAHIRALQAKANFPGAPKYYAVRALAHIQTTGQRYEMVMYPTPDIVYTLKYGYVVLPDTLTSTNKYPYGGALYSNLILAAVLSEAESLLDDDPAGPMHARFMELLPMAIRIDKQIKAVA